jgi:chromosomal replication initiation ATPase DnaA
MTYTPDQILAAVHADDDGLATYLLSTLDTDTLRTYALAFARRIPAPILETPADGIAWAMEQATLRAARIFNTTPADVLSTARYQEALEARQVVCYVGRTLGMPYKAIGRQVRRDHSTVMSAVSRVGETPRLKRIANGIAAELGHERGAVA